MASLAAPTRCFAWLARRVATSLALLGSTLLCADASASDADNASGKQACVAAADHGQLLRDSGRYAEARAQFSFCSDERCPAVVRQQCGEWLRSLIEATPTVVFCATDARGHDLTEVRVMVDGRPVAETLDGRPLGLDPGPHQVRFETRGKQAAVVGVMLRAGDKIRPVSAALADWPAAVDSAALVPLAKPPARLSGNGGGLTSIALFAASALSVGGGVAFALASKSEALRAASVRRAMTPSSCVQPSAPACRVLGEAVDAQGQDATASAALYIAGGVLALAATTTWFVSRGEDKANRDGGQLAAWPVFGPGYAGIHAQVALR